MDDEANPKRGQKREVQAEDKTGKAPRSSAATAPMTPGGLEGEDEVTMATMNGEDDWRNSQHHAIRVHSKRMTQMNPLTLA